MRSLLRAVASFLSPDFVLSGHGLFGCPSFNNSGWIDAILTLAELAIKPWCWVELLISMITQAIWDWFRNNIADPLIALFIDVPVPEPASGAIAWSVTCPMGSPCVWSKVYAVNSYLATFGVVIIALGAAIAMALGAIRAIPQQTKNKVYRRTIIGGVFVLFNRPFLALMLEFINTLQQFLIGFSVPGVSPGYGGFNACVTHYLFGVLGTGAGALIVIIVLSLNVLGLFLFGFVLLVFMLYFMVQVALDFMIFATFMFAPVFIAGWAVAHGPLAPLGKKGKKGLSLFMTAAMANLPAVMIWKTGCLLFGTNGIGASYFNQIVPGGGSLAGGLLSFLFSMMFLFMGFMATIKGTQVGEKVMGGVGTAVKVAGVGLATGGAAAGLAAAGASPRMAMKMGKQASQSVSKSMGFDSMGGPGKTVDPFDGNMDQALLAKTKSTANKISMAAGGGPISTFGTSDDEDGDPGLPGKLKDKVTFGSKSSPFDDFEVGDPESDDEAEVDQATGEFVGDRSDPSDDPASFSDQDNIGSEDDDYEDDFDDEVIARLEDDQIEAVFDGRYAAQQDDAGEFMNETNETMEDVAQQLKDNDDVDEDAVAQEFANEREEFQDWYEDGDAEEDATIDDVVEFSQDNAADTQLDMVSQGRTNPAEMSVEIQKEVRQDMDAIDNAVDNMRDEEP